MASIVTPGNLGPEFEIGTTTPSKITVKVDGTSVQRNGTTGALSAVPPTYNNTTKVITFPAQDGAAAFAIDLSSLITDIYVSGATLTGNTLTLTDTDVGTPNVTVDLSKYEGVSSTVGNIITADATDDNKAFLNVATLATVFTACQDAFGVDIFKALPA